jgi:hypothetical protein
MSVLNRISPSLNGQRRRARRHTRTACLALATLLLMLTETAVGATAAIGPGFSGMWYDPARSGEGLQLEVLDSNTAIVYWFTYDEQGKQRWFGGIGQIAHTSAGDSIQFPEMYVTHGGKFGPSFNPGDVQFQTVGNASVSFTDCNTGTFRYSAFGQSQTLPMQRLTQTMGAGCTSINGVPGQPVMPYAGQSGNWYDVAHSGEGFDLEWMADNQAVVSWYTYDTSGKQVWVMGVGTRQDDAIVFDNLFTTSGPHFGVGFDTSRYQEKAWGSLTLRLDCNQGTAHYASTQPGFGSGDFTLTRLTTLQKPACPYVKPRLSDLYDITWDELPIEPGTAQQPNFISAESIANDGTVAGRRGNLVLWHPDTRTWEDIDVSRELAAAPVEISPDGSAVIANEDFGLSTHAVIWQRLEGWRFLPGDNLAQSVYGAVSQNFQYVVGTGEDSNGDYPSWLLRIGGGQQLAPQTDSVSLLTPFAVADTGSTVVGVTLRFPNNFPEMVAVRWDTTGTPSIMHNPSGEELAVASRCDANCSIVFGAGLYDYNPEHVHPGEAWLLKSDGTFEYLGALADAVVSARSYAVSDATPDGSLVVGAYQTAPPSQNYPAAYVSRAFIWTETTGIISVRSLVNDLGIGDDDWDEMSAVRISKDGSKLLLAGLRRLDLSPLGYSRAVVLHLTPKSPSP